MYQILLVEDDKRIQEVVEDYFSKQADVDLTLRVVGDGGEALDLIYENNYDLVLLDVMLPGMSGFDICKEIRRNRETPIIFLTARGREEDVLYGYDLGCDDYIVKPFSLAALLAKVRALLNRANGTIISNEMKVGSITLNPRTMIIKVNGEEVELPPKQYMMLKLLMENKNMVISRETMLVRIWGYDSDADDRIIDNHMKKLRKSLGDEGKRIKTVICKGYKIEGI